MRKLAVILVTVSMLALSANVFVAGAFTVTPQSSITNLKYHPSPFYTQVPGVSVLPLQTFEYKLSVPSEATAAVTITEKIYSLNGTLVYNFPQHTAQPGGLSTFTLTWNGTDNTGIPTKVLEYVADGQYKLVISISDGVVLNSNYFYVYKCVSPQITLTQTPASIYYSANGSTYPVYYSLNKGSGAYADVSLKIYGPLSNPKERIITDVKSSNGNYSISWDGKINGVAAPTGSYTYTLSAAATVQDEIYYKVPSNSLSGSFTVNNAAQTAPVISGLSVSKNPFNPNKGITNLSYTLSGSIGFTTIVAQVFDTDDMVNAVKSWTLYNQSNGSLNLTWDGVSSTGSAVSDGAYTFKVSGSDGAFTLVPSQYSFTIDRSEGSADYCAGYWDVSADDYDCEAIEYVQDIGAITGMADGSFNQNGYLQRDQIAKIALKAFNLFNSSTEYCNGSEPFPDVDSSEWSYQYICRGKSLGMINGYSSGPDKGYFRPTRSVSRSEFLAFILRNLDENMPDGTGANYTDVASGAWYAAYGQYSKSYDLFTGAKLYPGKETTRVEVARVLYRLHEEGKL